ncbi:MAG: type II toxin-antitoxin system VapC family toxin [Candidatus Brocadiia bacterium]
METKPRVFVDSCVFISALKYRPEDLRSVALYEDPGTDEDTRQRASALAFQRLWQAATDGKITLVTSTIALVECRHIREDRLLSPESHKAIRAVLDGGLIEHVQAGFFVCANARAMFWEEKVSFGTIDAFIVSSAIAGECAEIVTLDRNWVKHPPNVSALKARGIAVNAPYFSETLPDEYRRLLPL